MKNSMPRRILTDIFRKDMKKGDENPICQVANRSGNILFSRFSTHYTNNLIGQNKKAMLKKHFVIILAFYVSSLSSQLILSGAVETDNSITDTVQTEDPLRVVQTFVATTTNEDGFSTIVTPQLNTLPVTFTPSMEGDVGLPVFSEITITRSTPPLPPLANAVPEIELNQIATSATQAALPLRKVELTGSTSIENGSGLTVTAPAQSFSGDFTHHLVGAGAPVFKTLTVITSLDKTTNLQNNGTISVKAFCGYPPYSDRQGCITQNYYKEKLSQCEVQGEVIVFCFFIVLLGILIIFANVLLPLVMWKNPGMRTGYDTIKVSLAFADMLMGILLTSAVLPNVFRIRNMTLEQAVQYVDNDTNSASAIITGSLLIVSTQASVLHLMFLSIERFTAIKWPFWWQMKRKTSSIAITIAVLWAVSLILSFIPAAFPKYFEYKLQPALLIHMITLKKLPGDDNGETGLSYQGPLYAFFSLILPYSIMITFCILTGIVAYKKLTSRVRKFNKVHEGKGTKDPLTKERDSRIKLKPEIFVFITTAIMILAFTITILPFTIVMVRFVIGQLKCSNYTIPYVVSFYIGMLNSLANAFIYTVRDQKFRLAVRAIFSTKADTSKYSTKITSNPGSNQGTQL